MKKVLLIISIFLILLLVVFFATRKNEVTIYLGIANSELAKIDLNLSIDGKQIFCDSIVGFPNKYKTFKIDMNCGKHSLELFSKKGEIEMKDTFYLTWNQYLILEYYTNEGNTPLKTPIFLIRNSFVPFYQE